MERRPLLRILPSFSGIVSHTSTLEGPTSRGSVWPEATPCATEVWVMASLQSVSLCVVPPCWCCGADCQLQPSEVTSWLNTWQTRWALLPNLSYNGVWPHDWSPIPGMENEMSHLWIWVEDVGMAPPYYFLLLLAGS